MSSIKSRLESLTNMIGGDRKASAQDANQIPWSPDSVSFPAFDELPQLPNTPDGAAWVWGKNDSLGRINLLTPARVKKASATIRSGEIVPLNLPVDEPNPPAFPRMPFQHTIKALRATAFDDEYSLNTQSSTQWDGFRHVGHPSGVFYNGVTADIIKSTSANDATSEHPNGIHHISQHGISARAIFLDYQTWSLANSAAINPFSREAISLGSLLACGEYQGLNLTPACRGGDVQPGDILLIRIGFTARYRSLSTSEWTELTKREPAEKFWAGIDGGSEELRTWIHDCYFAAVASDAPALEVWPPVDAARCLHTSMLPLWGCMIGEFFDLERLSERCRAEKRWTFFFASSPPNVKGGVGAWANAMAIL